MSSNKVFVSLSLFDTLSTQHLPSSLDHAYISALIHIGSSYHSHLHLLLIISINLGQYVFTPT